MSSYATMHPAEDWAETFAHYLHIRDTLDTAAAFGFAPASATFERRVLGPSGFDTIIEMWLPLSWALNMVNRSMGHDDLYPFVLPVAVLEKMRFIHTVIDEVTAFSGKADPVQVWPRRRHGTTRRSSGPHSGCMPPGSESCVAVMTSASSRSAVVHRVEQVGQFAAAAVARPLRVRRGRAPQPGADLVDQPLRSRRTRRAGQSPEVRPQPLELVDQRPRVLRVEQHQLGHAPPRSPCPACAGGRSPTIRTRPASTR